ncbi:Rhodanese-like domain-containing protein [Sporodiniella umbellata]|nr:Rhodanese-like domain-containing protein [Sporodiniella umbellata]
MTPTFAEPEEVMSLVCDSTKHPEVDYVVVDVRDNDYIGGHIPGSINVPAGRMYEEANELIQKYSKVPVIYFHCALSQVRGPKSARIYSETLTNLGIATDQKVKIMRYGFEGWHSRYKFEKELIEDYNPQVWEWAA